MLLTGLRSGTNSAKIDLYIRRAIKKRVVIQRRDAAEHMPQVIRKTMSPRLDRRKINTCGASSSGEEKDWEQWHR